MQRESPQESQESCAGCAAQEAQPEHTVIHNQTYIYINIYQTLNPKPLNP